VEWLKVEAQSTTPPPQKKKKKKKKEKKRYRMTSEVSFCSFAGPW
jgi:hypothetical protein